MEKIEAKLLLSNLIDRLSEQDDGKYVIDGKLTSREVEALRMTLDILDGGSSGPQPTPAQAQIPPNQTPPTVPAPVSEPEADPDSESGRVPSPAPLVHRLDIEKSVQDLLSLPDAPMNIRLCLDFGTAMSKATLVMDGEDDYEDEQITVLELGRHGDGQEEYMLTSAVYIDNDGKLWFGKKAEDNCTDDWPDGEHQFMDNIKHWLSLGQVDETVDPQFNPTQISVTYADVILAYLTFLTWCVNEALQHLEQPSDGYPRNLNRRFAMPCLSGSEFKEMKYRLNRYLGEAQVLADVFYHDIRNGLSLERFVEAVKTLRAGKRYEYRFVHEGITEPLGVAGTLLNYASEDPHHMVVMVIDIGAGTSDFSVYRMFVDPENDRSIAVEAEGSVEGVTEAGNHLDSTLMGLLYRKLGFDGENVPPRVQWRLTRNIREFKEELFNRERLYISLDEYEAEVTLEEFLASQGVQDFKDSLDRKMLSILESISPDWIDLIGTKVPYLTVALSGGGAGLPMVRELADREIIVRGRAIRLVPARAFPTWLEEAHAALVLDYPRIAVSLGGARKKLIKSLGSANITAGGITGEAVYDDPKYQW